MKEETRRMSVGAMIAMIVMVLGMIGLAAGLPMVILDRPAWVITTLCVGGGILAFVGAIFYHNLTLTEEEGRITPPPAGRENNCEEDPEIC